MQQSITRRDVYEPALSATINGEDARLESVSIDRELPDPYAGGAVGADGQIVAVSGPDVSDRVPTPWDPGSQWPPVPESPVSVRMDTGAGPVSILGDGRVKAVDGGTGDRTSAMTVADRFQSLDRPISWEPFADAMPALTEATSQRYVSLHAAALTDRILRHCGWYCTPPRVGYTVLSVPAMGTMWPEAGYLQTSIAKSPGRSFPTMFAEPWGKGVSDVTATYERAAEYTVKSRGRVEMTAVAGRRNGGTMHLVARTDTFRRFRLAWTDNSAVLYVTDGAGAYAEVARLPRQVGSFIYATIEYVSDTTVLAWLQVDSASTSATVTVHPDLTTMPLTVFDIDGDGVGGGFQVGYPSTSRALASWTPNAVIYDRASSANALQVAKPVQGENCLDLLMDQCKAQAATFWIDETGVLRWWDLARLEAQTPVAILTSDRDITAEGFRWSHTRSQVKRSVTVNWQEPLVEGGWRTNVDLWQGNGSTLATTDANNPAEEWIKVPDDEVWIMPDLGLNRIGDGGFEDFNYGWGSHYGAVTRTPGGADEWAQISGSFLVTIERVTDTAFKYVTTWTGSRQAVQRTPAGAESGALWGIRRNFDLPILRGKKKYKVADREYRAAQMGPSTAPDHVINAGWWIQSEAQAQYTADYAAARLTVAHPVLSSIGIVPLPGLQIGDVVTVTDTAETRLTVRGVVSRDARAAAAGMDLSHAVALRPVAVSRNGVTWAEWASVVRPDTWQQWASNQGGTWREWGTDPLGQE